MFFTDPVRPWSENQLGPAALALLVLVLLGVTVWTYVGVPGAAPRRVVVILVLRLLALGLALLVVLRPSFAKSGRDQEPAVLYVLVDASASMSITDENDRSSRWDLMVRHLDEAAPEFRRLREEGRIETVFVRFGDDVKDFDPESPGQADGKRTDIALALQETERRDRQRPPRAVLVLSDGADNGGHDFRSEARKWRKLSCPVHTFAYGRTETPDRRKDLRLVKLTTRPTPTVPLKGKPTVRVVIDAPGYADQKVRLRVFLEKPQEARRPGGEDAEVVPSSVVRDDLTEEELKELGLPKPAAPSARKRGKEASPVVQLEQREIPDRRGKSWPDVFELELPALDRKGEYRLTVLVEPEQPPQDKVALTNNKMRTFLTVAKEGMKVLLIDKRRDGEPQAIYDALKKQESITPRTLWVGGGTPTEPAKKLLDLETEKYDVVIIGDVSPDQLRAIRKDVIEVLARMVNDEEHRTGLLMMGGYNSFSQDWKNSDVGKCLPVDMTLTDEKNPRLARQYNNPIKFAPTEEGLKGTMLRLSESNSPADWEKLPELRGLTEMGQPIAGKSVVLAESKILKKLMLVSGKAGAGRTLVFAGDTTHHWIRDPESKKMHARFWKQVVAWLAQQDDPETIVKLVPDRRRTPIGEDLGFDVSLRNKRGDRVPDARFDFQAFDEQDRPVAGAGGRGQGRAVFAGNGPPGTYRLKVTATDPNDPKGGGEAEVRFEVYDDDREMLHQAAQVDVLNELAQEGGSRECHNQFEEYTDEYGIKQKRRLNALPAVLRELESQAEGKGHRTSWPAWKSERLTAFVPLLFLAFAATLGSEWWLRRRWGLA
jgi:uncharacterized membrane protein